MVDPPRARDLLAAGEAYLADVRGFRDEVGRDRFLAERGEQYRIQFPLQQAIQICIDLAAHLVAESVGHRPDTLAELFVVLADRGVVGRDLGVRLGAMARFRNLLVHEYAEVDPSRVWEIVTGNLDDVEAFLGVVARRVEQT